MTLRAAILSTGDELTTGRIADTNASWIADKLFELGIDVVAILAVGDYPDRLAWAWRKAMALADVVISTGWDRADGRRPHDGDRRRGARRAARARPAVGGPHPRLLRVARHRHAREQREAGALPGGRDDRPEQLRHRAGLSRDAGRQASRRPARRAARDEADDGGDRPPVARDLAGEDPPLVRTFQTFGISESGLDELVAGAVDPAEARLSFRASFPEISMRVVVRGADAEARLERISARVRERLGPWVIGEGAVTMEQVVGDALRAKGLTLGLAESCTGGLIAHRVTNVPGSSAYFRGGIGAYANDVKTRLLGVSPDTLARHGAVSEETAREMAAGARRALGVDVAARHDGHRRPGRGTPEKPVGLVASPSRRPTARGRAATSSGATAAG
jgi:nicotinamide-nucleotide amidase